MFCINFTFELNKLCGVTLEWNHWYQSIEHKPFFPVYNVKVDILYISVPYTTEY